MAVSDETLYEIILNCKFLIPLFVNADKICFDTAAYAIDVVIPVLSYDLAWERKFFSSFIKHDFHLSAKRKQKHWTSDLYAAV